MQEITDLSIKACLSLLCNSETGLYVQDALIATDLTKMHAKQSKLHPVKLMWCFTDINVLLQ